MAKKLYEVEYDDDLHLADASDDPEYKRGLLYDDDGNLKAHAKMREVNEDELRDRYAEPYYSYDDYSYNNQSSQEEEQGLTEEEIEALVALGALIAGAVIEAAPHVKRWWDETAFPHIHEFFGNIAGFFQKKPAPPNLGDPRRAAINRTTGSQPELCSRSCHCPGRTRQRL